MKFNETGRTILFVGLGGLAGLAVGGLVTNADAAIASAGIWFLILAGVLGLAYTIGREKETAGPAPEAPPKTRTDTMGATEAARGVLGIEFAFPSIPKDFPAVVGLGEEFRVHVRAMQSTGPAVGAAIRLNARDRGGKSTHEGVAGEDGSIAFVLTPERTGAISLQAEASLPSARGAATAEVMTVRFEEEIQRLFSEFRTYAMSVLGADAEADTARELADRLRPMAGEDAARALLELARIYELVAYGEREADRALYQRVMEQLLVLENADLPDAPVEAIDGGAPRV